MLKKRKLQDKKYSDKHLVLRTSLLKKARQVLNAKTDTETVEGALKIILFEHEKNKKACLERKLFVKNMIQKDFKTKVA